MNEKKERQLTLAQQAEHSLTSTYRERIWNKFIRAVKEYRLIEPGDRIAVCISGGKDSMLLAKLVQMLERHTEAPFEAVYLVMDPGYNAENRRRIEENAAKLELPITIFETDIFAVADRADRYPCYLCAKMRRGHLYKQAKALGCNKIALGHHLNDVIETTVMALFYSSQLQGMMPKLRSQNYAGLELIRPLYHVREDDIIAWSRRHELEFIRCACRFTEGIESGESDSKRKEVKELIATLKKDNPNIEKSIFNALHAVHINTFPGVKAGGENIDFNTLYERMRTDKPQNDDCSENEADNGSVS